MRRKRMYTYTVMGMCMLLSALPACKKSDAKDTNNAVTSTEDTSYNSNQENFSENTTDNTDTISDVNVTDDIVEAELPDNAEFTYVTAEYQLGTVNIKYPVVTVSGHEDTNYSVLQNVNDIIKADALSILNNYSVDDGTDSVNVDYSAFIDGDGNISVKFSGDAMFSMAAHPAVIICTSNVNIYSGTRFRPVSDDKLSEIAAYFEPGKDYEVCEDNEEVKTAVEDYLNNYDISMLTSELNNMDFRDDDRQTPLTYSYQDEDGVYIIVNVPTAIGQYAVLKLL